MSYQTTSPSPTAPIPRILSRNVTDHAGQTVRIAGWLHSVRALKNVTFLIVRDREGLTQVVLQSETERTWTARLAPGTVLEVVGEVTASRQAAAGAEITDARVTVLSPADEPPTDLHRPGLRASLPTRLDHAPVLLRHPRAKAAFAIGAAAVQGFRETLSNNSFTEIFTPKIVGTATESGANVFSLDYFGGPAYLAQSPQFYKQTMVGVFERVFEVGPVFRAEPHDSVRHLAEYTSLDVEFGFVRHAGEVADMLRDVLEGMLTAVAERASQELATLEVELPPVPATLPSLHFRQALALCAPHTGTAADAPDLAPADERWLGEWARAEHGSDFLVVTGYPMRKRPFYTAPDPDRPEYSDSFDLLFRGTELVTGGRRLHRYDDYVAAITAGGEPVERYTDYLQAFRYGMPPHGGFAIGLERFVAQLTRAANIREVTLFPRDMHRLTP